MPKRSQSVRRVAETSSTRAAPLVSPPRVKLLAGVAVIAVAALLAYLPSLGGEFILDDDLYVTNSPLIKAPDGLYRFWFTTEPADYWPASNSTFWIEWRLWGMNPTGYHVTNLVLHFASALLIWLILRKLSIPGAWLAALLFAVHPVNIESVAWIAQRKNTLSMLFFLLSILWYLKADGGAGPRLRRERSAERRWYALSLLAFTLSMLSKGSVAILPLVLLLLAWWQRGSITKRDLVRTAPFFVVAVVLAGVNVWFQTHGADIEVRSAGFAERLAGAGAVVWFYLYKALVPLNLVFIYPQWDIRVSNPLWWLPLMAAVIVTALLLWNRDNRYGRTLLFAWLFFCVALLPVMGFADVGFMQFTLVADHYQHIAIIGVIALVAAGLALLDQQAQRAPARRGSAAMATAGIVAVLLTYLSWQQSSLYVDPMTLYEATLVKNPHSWLAYSNLGATLVATGRKTEAIECYRQALRLNPDYAEAHYNLALELAASGRRQEAIEHYMQALRCRPQYAKAHYDLALALAASGHRQEAIEHYRQALRSKSDYADAHNNLGIELASAGRLQEAIEHYRQALEQQPDLAETHNNLALALFNCGRSEEAIEHFQQAVRLQPRFAEAYLNLGNVLAGTGQWPEAIEQFQQSLRLKPDLPEAHGNLGIALAQFGRLPEAIEHFQQAVRLKPDHQECHFNLARAYAKLNRPQEAIATAKKALDLARAAGQTNKVQQIERWLTSYRASLKGGQGASPQPGATSPSP